MSAPYHELRLLKILEAASAPVSLSELSENTTLQKSVISSVLRDAAYWGRVSIKYEPTQNQTYYTTPRKAQNCAYLKHARWVRYTPPLESMTTHPQLVGNFKLLNYLQQEDCPNPSLKL